MNKEQKIRIDHAADYLRKQNYLVVDSNAMPIKGMARKVIPLVVYDQQADMMIGVSVHGSDLPRHHAAFCENALVTTAARERFAILMRQWCKINKWRGRQAIASCGVRGRADKPTIDLMYVQDTSPTKLGWC